MKRDEFTPRYYDIRPLSFGPKPSEPDIEFLIDGLLPKGYLVTLAGEPDPERGGKFIRSANERSMSQGRNR